MVALSQTSLGALPDLHGQIALVTGASRGIGRSTACVLAAAGARVILLARGAQSLEAVAEDIKAQGGSADLCAADVTEPETFEPALADVLSHTGAPNILVNCAASGLISRAAPVETLSALAMTQDFETKFGGYLRVIQAVLAPMRERQYGRILNIGGFTLHDPQEPSGFRNAAVAHLTRYLAQQLAPTGVTVVALHPAHAVELKQSDANAAPALSGGTDLTYQQVSEAIAHFCGPWASVLNGESILLGGAHLPVMRY